MVDRVNVWEPADPINTVFVDQLTFVAVASGAEAEVSVAHGLGTDNVMLAITVRGVGLLATSALAATALAMAFDQRFIYQGTLSTTPPTPLLGPIAGEVKVRVRNNHASAQDIVVDLRVVANTHSL